MAHDVFISYSTKDKTIADAVCAKLEEHNIRVWIAPRDVPPGSNFAQSIIRAINNCKVFVLIWSANSNTSNHILNEINQAFDQGITIIPFRIQDIQPTDEMRYYFGRTHWLDAITPPLENHIAVLRDTILVNLGCELQPAAPPPRPEESPKETVKPAEELRPVRKPVIEKAEEAEPPVTPPRLQKPPKVKEEIHRPTALPAKFTKYIPFAAGGLVLLTLVILLVSGVFKDSPPAEIAQASPSPTSAVTPTSPRSPTSTHSPTSTVRPTSTIRPTMTSEPLAPDPFPSAIQMALDLINRTVPNYQTGFTSWEFGDPVENVVIVAGKLIVTNENSEDLKHTSIGIFRFSSARFAIQTDFRILEAGPEGHCGLEVSDGDGESRRTLNLAFSSSGQAGLGHLVYPDVPEIAVAKGTFDFSKSTTITLLILGDQITSFINGELAYTIQNPDGSPVFVNQQLSANYTAVCEYDNYKFWDLEEIEEAIAQFDSIHS